MLMKVQGTKWHIRWMIQRDLDAVVQIEGEQAGEWDREGLTQALRNHDTIGMVITDSKTDAVMGFLIYRLRDGHYLLRKLEVHPKCEGRGLGSALLADLLRKCANVQQIGNNRRNRVEVDPNDCGEGFLLHSGALIGPVRSSQRHFGTDVGKWFPPLPEIRAEWLTSDVQFMCGGDEAPDLAVLADALQEAGCEHEWLLNIFRKNGAMGRAVFDVLKGEFTRM